MKSSIICTVLFAVGVAVAVVVAGGVGGPGEVVR